MADYYSILSKTISRLPANTPENRNTVYQKARGAIEKQLRSLNPPPPESAIEAQLKSLEEAATVIESEYASPPQQEPDLAAEMAAILGGDDQTTQSSVPAPQNVSPPESETPPVSQTQPEPLKPENVVIPPSAEVVASAVPAANVDMPVSPPANVPPPAPEAIPEPISAGAAPQVPEATLPPPVSQAPLPPMEVPEPASASAPLQQVPVSNEPLFDDEERKSGGFGKFLAALLLIAALGGGGYALWINRDSLGEVVSSFGLGADTQQAEEKEPVRIGQNGQDEVVQQDEERSLTPEQTTGEQAQQSDPVPSDEPPLQTEQATGEQSDIEQPAVPADETQTAQEEPVTPEPQQEQTSQIDPATPTGESEANGSLPIGEVAYLYEEGTAGSGATRTSASVLWSLEREAPSEDASPEPVILGRMQVPDQGLDLDIKIRRNTDTSLSASHLIEMRFSLPEDFQGQSINAIARFVLKGTEEERGEPLVAVPAKVGDGYFLIALDNLPQAVEVNTRLLREGQWIDIPISYQTGKRALVTLEKGGTGERVFTEAFDVWKNLSGS